MTTSGKGGAIFIFSCSPLSVERTLFLSISATEHGGAIHFNGERYEILHTCGSNCHASADGGFLWFHPDDVSLTDCAECHRGVDGTVFCTDRGTVVFNSRGSTGLDAKRETPGLLSRL
jgi:hypothetical protein